MERSAKIRKSGRLLEIVLLIFFCCTLMTGCTKEAGSSREEELAEQEQKRLELTATPEAVSEQEKAEEQETEESPSETAALETTPGEAPVVMTPEEPELSGTGKKVAIDPGHQAHGNSGQEPVGPGASETKAKVASGTSGRTTGVAEYELNLTVALKLKEELLKRGYEVYMIRETHEVDISNAERAQLAAESGADILVRIHANGSENSSVAGALTMSPSQANPYMEGELIAQCQKLSEIMIQDFCEATGAANQGVYQTDTMSGLNWCSIPSTIVEMGYMTNPEEDTKMQTEEYQGLMVQGMANGIDHYFIG